MEASRRAATRAFVAALSSIFTGSDFPEMVILISAGMVVSLFPLLPPDWKFLPENLFVIATMNTADRSLAVVDFALRRRFTWLTLKPHKIQDINFQEGYFNDFDSLFQKYATDDELNLQPGQSYFIAKDEEEMKTRLEYEIMPLMKEYFNEGYLLKAKDEFSNYFYNKLGVLMYE